MREDCGHWGACEAWADGWCPRCDCVSPSPRTGTREVIGRVQMACPNDCGTVLDTDRAAYVLMMDGDGLRWCGVPCDCCGKTFTIECVPNSAAPAP